MTKRPQKPEAVKVLNPRYEGATPEDVGRTFLNHRPEDNDESELGPINFQSGM